MLFHLGKIYIHPRDNALPEFGMRYKVFIRRLPKIGKCIFPGLEHLFYLYKAICALKTQGNVLVM